jgi:Zn-dependent protease
MRRTIPLGRLFDIRVGVHVSWLVLFAFVTTSITGSISGFSRPAAFCLAGLCALLLFASVIGHELAHALVARRFGVRTSAITLFLFGGVASLEREPPSPRAEVAIGLAGPLMSALLAVLAFALLGVVERWAAGPLGDAVAVTLAYLALANGALAAFNLVPAFPMDGGRVLRAAVWHFRKSRTAATGAAALVGLVVAAVLVAGGIVIALSLRAWQELWYSFVGGFLLRAAWLQFRDSRAVERRERGPAGESREALAAAELAPQGLSPA